MSSWSLAVGQFRRVEQDQVVLSRAIAEPAERGEGVGLHELADVDAVQLAVARGAASAGPDESIDVTRLAPRAAAITLNAPV